MRAHYETTNVERTVVELVTHRVIELTLQEAANLRAILDCSVSHPKAWRAGVADLWYLLEGSGEHVDPDPKINDTSATFRSWAGHWTSHVDIPF